MKIATTNFRNNKLSQQQTSATTNVFDETFSEKVFGKHFTGILTEKFHLRFWI
jgi:hypothetical protein